MHRVKKGNLMKKYNFIGLSIIIILLIILVVHIVIPNINNDSSVSSKHFDNGAIAFDYPSNMRVADHGSDIITVYDENSNQILNTALSSYSVIPNGSTSSDPNES